MMVLWMKQFPRGVPLLLLNSMLMSIGFFSLIPYLSYHLTNHLLWTSFLAGLLLMVRQFTQQGISFFAGMAADRLGYKRMIISGLFIRGLGFCMFAFAEHPISLFAAAIVTGLGGAIFEPAGNAALSALTPEDKRSEMFAIRKVLSNTGMALAALVGGFLILFDFMYISLLSGGMFILMAGLTLYGLPAIHVEVERPALRQMWTTVIHDRPFLFFTLITVGLYFMYMQLFLTIPLHGIQVFERPQAVSLVLLIFAISVVLSQVFILRWLTPVPLMLKLKLGLGLMGTGLIILGTAGHSLIFVVGMFLFAFGAMVAEPTTLDIISRFAERSLLASYFGFASLGMAIGGGLSQGVGGWLWQFGQDIQFSSLLWWVAGGVAVLSIFGAYRLERRMKNRRYSAPVPPLRELERT